MEVKMLHSSLETDIFVSTGDVFMIYKHSNLGCSIWSFLIYELMEILLVLPMTFCKSWERTYKITVSYLK